MPVRLNITIDEDVHKRLKRELPAKGISRFINDAVRAHLRPSRKALDEGRSVDTAFSAVREFLDEWSREIRAGKISRQVDDPKAIWTEQAAAEAARWRRKFGDERIRKILKTAIRLEPFEIHRRAEASG